MYMETKGIEEMTREELIELVSSLILIKTSKVQKRTSNFIKIGKIEKKLPKC